MFDCDGNHVFPGARQAYSTAVEGGELDGLKSGWRQKPPLSTSWCTVLRDLIAHPGSTIAQVSKRIDADAGNRIYDMVGMRYIAAFKSDSYMKYATLTVTPEGVEALNREPLKPGVAHTPVYDL